MGSPETKTGKTWRDIVHRLTDDLLCLLPKSEALFSLSLLRKLPKSLVRHVPPELPYDVPQIRTILRGTTRSVYGPPLVRACFGAPSESKTLTVASLLMQKDFVHDELVEPSLMSILFNDHESLALLLKRMDRSKLPHEIVDEWARLAIVGLSNGTITDVTPMVDVFLEHGYMDWVDSSGNGFLSRLMNPWLKDTFVMVMERLGLPERNGNGDSLMHLAAYGKADIAFFLERLPQGWLELKNDKGQTPLHVALRNSNVEKVKILSAAGADWSAETSTGASARSLIWRMNAPLQVKEELSVIASNYEAEKLRRKVPLKMASRDRGGL